jgi:iron complex outermembrane recepter protein
MKYGFLAASSFAAIIFAQPVLAEDDAGDIVVTAQKKGEQSLSKVPVPIGVVNTADLVQQGQVRIQDFASKVPSLIVAPAAVNKVNLSIRGINQDGQDGSPTVGIMIDDLPFGSSTAAYVPELDPGDLTRIEVLRGPQGTLYGADSMGGLVRYITVAPSTKGLSGQVSSGADLVQNGNGVGFNLRGSVNVPMADNLAVRASGFYREGPGYIRNITTGEPGDNDSRAYGGRVALLWMLRDNVSLTLTALGQSFHADASNEVIPALGDLTTNTPKDGSTTNTDIADFSATLRVDLDDVTITSVTGYNTVNNDSRHDYSYRLGGLAHAFFGVPPYVTAELFDTSKRFIQEVMADTKIGSHLDVQLGGYFSHEDFVNGSIAYGLDPLTGEITTDEKSIYYDFAPQTLNEYAAYGNFTYRFNDRFDVQAGGRISHIDLTSGDHLSYFIFNDPNPEHVPQVQEHATPFTYLLTPRFQINSDLMVYARFASGYRPGGTNGVQGAPETYAPDRTYTYEAGLKGRFLDGMLTADVSVYHIDWKDVQIEQRTPTFLNYTGNGGRAKSQGIEFSSTLRPFKGTTISGWINYGSATLAEDFPDNTAAYGKEGDKLPQSADVSGYISARQDVPLSDSVTGFASIDLSYVGERLGVFQVTPVREIYPAYTQVNMQIGASFSGWDGSLYVNNIGDVRGKLNGGLGYVDPHVFLLIQPRTAGVSVAKHF